MMTKLLIVAPHDIDYAKACDIVFTAWGWKAECNVETWVVTLNDQVYREIRLFCPDYVVLLIDSLELEARLQNRLMNDPQCEQVELHDLSHYVSTQTQYTTSKENIKTIGPDSPDGVKVSFCLRRSTDPTIN